MIKCNGKENGMQERKNQENTLSLLDPHKQADRAWFLSLLSDEEQRTYEETHIGATMRALRYFRIRPHQRRITDAETEMAELQKGRNPSAEDYRRIKELSAYIEKENAKIDEYRPFFDEPYFARMDLIDEKEGYNSYYIGKKGDLKLEILDWRAPVSRRYYQKSCASFAFGEYVYKTVLRRAIRTKNGKLVDFKNEYLSLKDFLSEEEIGGKDEENILDPFLKEIIQSRKEDSSVQDIIRTIQEKQYEIITCPETTDFVLQGCAGSGKTMVMLHRLSYLMYNHDDVKPHDVLIITPSNSFNAFIEELANVLELERVRTVTVYEYFLQVLKNEKIFLRDRIDPTKRETDEYLRYVYSERFRQDVKKKLDKVYDSLYGLFTGEECKDFLAEIVAECKKQIRAYDSIKNASTRVRRAVLGEIRERKDGSHGYTKPFRELMNCVLDIDDFFTGTLQSENAKNPDYFYRQLLSFYKSATFTVKRMDDVIAGGAQSLDELQIALEKEIVELKRFKQRSGGEETYLYAERIERRKELVAECAKIKEKVLEIGENHTAFAEFYSYLRGEKNFAALGNGDDFVDTVRFFYRETVKKYKAKYGMTDKTMYVSDAYALCVICWQLGRRLTPAYSYVFVDEAQDISEGEYALLRAINAGARFNMFGDVEQNVTPYRGVKDWKSVFPDFVTYGLNQNYRNTTQIVEFVAKGLQVDMQSIGFDGPPVAYLSPREIHSYFKDKKGLKAIICSKEHKEKYLRKARNDLAQKGAVSRSKINVMTVYESKGLEFSAVVVDPADMSPNERYIAYTRALKDLAVIK